MRAKGGNGSYEDANIYSVEIGQDVAIVYEDGTDLHLIYFEDEGDNFTFKGAADVRKGEDLSEVETDSHLENLMENADVEGLDPERALEGVSEDG